ncbi:hypothetical protein DPMN_015574 [Dreissena polymorpha]|uniref:Uncharacterized protein n=1 Tax=Dreissena polymorpha TaxID=45954 RepID=A0A9D4N811_DREPO|nr:hypothetical protein DPMN_015574 [Dreissena polymorpha]
MFAKVDTETKTDRDRREDVKKKTVKKQLQRFDCLSSEMNACQAIVKPDCTKPKVLKSSGMKNALVKTVHEAISNTNEENNNILEEHNLIFLSKRSIPKPVMETASHATIEFAGVKFKTNASSGQQYLKYIENGVIKKTQLQLPNVQELAICEEKYQFTPDDFKAATRSQRVSKKAYSVTHLKTSEEMLSSETFHKNSIVTTPQGKSLISTYLARNIHKIKVQKPITISIDSELHMSNCSCPEHPKCCCCPRYAHPICAKMYADKEPDIDILTYIKQTKGEAEMSQVDWLTEYQDRLLDGNACVSIVTSGDIDAVVIHMFALSHGWPRTSDGKFKNSVFVILQKPVGLYDTYHVTDILTALEEKWNDKNIGMKLALVLSMAGNDFLPKLHGISHTKTVEVFLQYPHLRSSLFDFEHPSDCTIHVKLNPDIYTELIKYLYCAKKLNADDFSFDEIHQMSILPVNARSLEDYRNPQLWMPPISTIEKMSKNVQCLIDYYLTAGDHSKQMPNFLLCGSLTKTEKGEIEFDLGPDSHINRIGECVVTDPGELALRLRKKGKRKPEETPQKGRRRKLRPQAQSTPR